MIYADFGSILISKNNKKQNPKSHIRTDIKNILLAFLITS